MSAFTPGRKFKRHYNRLFQKDPLGANVFFLLAELANERGDVRLGPIPEAEIALLMAVRFDDCRAYQLPGGPKK